MNPLERLTFLEELHQKTVVWHDNYLPGNIHVPESEFTDYLIPVDDFKKVREIVRDEILLVLPKETILGGIEGYCVLDLQCNLLLQFGEKNISKKSGLTLQKLFSSLVCSKQNLEICEQLEEDFCLPSIKEAFDDY